MGNKRNRRNLYFYNWDRKYMDVALKADRVSCCIRDFEYDDNLDDFAELKNSGIQVAAYLPALWEDFYEAPVDELRELADYIYVGNPGQIKWANKVGVPLLGDVGLNVFNAATAGFFADKGLWGVTASYELDDDLGAFTEIRKKESDGELSEPFGLTIPFGGGRLAAMEIEVLRYGRVPAMVSQYCPLAGAKGIKGSACKSCMDSAVVYLKDRMGERYPVLLDDADCTSIILSKTPLNRGNAAKKLRGLDNGIERVCVFDESPAFLLSLPRG